MGLRLVASINNYSNEFDNETILKFQTISNALATAIDNGDTESIASILWGEGYFESLSEDHKAQVFRHRTSLITDANRQSTMLRGTFLLKVADHDSPTYLQQMLPYMPLHKFQTCSLQPGLSWIRSEKWLKDLLVKHKVRWNPDSNAGNSESVPQKASDTINDSTIQNDDDDDMLNHSSVSNEHTIQKIRNLAFTMLAAELFYIFCLCKAIRCCEYLLRIAPNLVEVKAGDEKAVALCTALMYDSSKVINLLLEEQAPIGNIAQAIHLIFLKSQNPLTFFFIKNKLSCIDNKEEVTHFMDENGNTLLHLLFDCNSYWIVPEMRDRAKVTDCFYSCVQKVLDYGVDPCVMNNQNETALDKLIAFYASRSFRDHYRTARKEIFLLCLGRILSYWGVKLPSGFLCEVETVKPSVAVIMVAELLLKDDQIFKFTIRSLQIRELLFKCLPTNCQLCCPTVSLFYQAMCKGIDIHSIPGEPIFNKGWKCKDYVSSLLVCSRVMNIIDCRNHRFLNQTHTSDHRHPLIHQTSSECSHWALLEFLIHSGNNVFSHMDVRDVFRRTPVSPVCVLNHFLTSLTQSWVQMTSESHLDKIRAIMVMLNMYSPSLMHQLLAYPLGYGDSTEALMLKTIAKMVKEMKRVRSLQLLCRLTIRGSVMFKDIEKLTLPENLKRYLRIGEIPNDHVIDKIINEETKETEEKDTELKQ